MKIPGSRRILVIVGAATGAGAIAVPAALGLSDNPSFSQRIPVRAPSSAHLVQFDDHGGAVELVHRHHDAQQPAEPGDDRTPSATSSTSAEPDPGDDGSGHDGSGHDGSGHDGSDG